MGMRTPKSLRELKRLMSHLLHCWELRQVVERLTTRPFQKQNGAGNKRGEKYQRRDASKERSIKREKCHRREVSKEKYQRKKVST